jgi:hypothetical protein
MQPVAPTEDCLNREKPAVAQNRHMKTSSRRCLDSLSV